MFFEIILIQQHDLDNTGTYHKSVPGSNNEEMLQPSTFQHIYMYRVFFSLLLILCYQLKSRIEVDGGRFLSKSSISSSLAFVTSSRRHPLSLCRVQSKRCFERKQSLQDVQEIHENSDTTSIVKDDVAINTTTASNNNRVLLDEMIPSSLTTTIPTTTSQLSNDKFWMNIGSVLTTESCPLIGIKSLGIDYGLSRTGVALTIGYEPIPLGIITSHNVTNVCHSIVKYASIHQVQQIIVGLPLHKNGTIAEQTLITLNFTQQLVMNVISYLGPNIHVYLFDERYTSKMAAAREHSKNPSSILYGTLDATAACIILENYYEDHGVGAHHVTLPNNNDLYEQCIQQYNERQSIIEQYRIQQINNEIDKRQRRLELIAQSKLIDQQQQQQQLNTNNDMIKKRKRKKKK